MKIHRLLIEQLAKDLVEVFANHQRAELVLEQSLKAHRKWGSRDRRFYAENFFACVRWWRKLNFCLNWTESASVSVQQALNCWACHWILSGQALPESFADLKIDSVSIKSRALELSKNPNLLAVAESIPDWMNSWGRQERGDRWPSLIHSLNEAPAIDLRVNTLKISRQGLQTQLAKDGIRTEPLAHLPDALQLMERKNLLSHPCFLQGFFELQDRGSQQIAPLLPVGPGATVIDACAGAGGKSLHLASLMKNKGKIISMDIHAWKLQRLQERALRNGVKIIETQVITQGQTIQKFASAADAVLLDVPCSGMGVIRRHADSKWKLSAEEIKNVLVIQQNILQEYSSMVKPGGYLLYATCSIMNSENQGQVQNFLNKAEAQKSDWSLLKDLQIDPDQNQGDGFFAALLQRK